MGDWVPALSSAPGGRFRIVITRLTRGGRRVDVTTFRGAPTVIGSYSSGDPFGDSTATLSFPAILPTDDLEAPDIAAWYGDYSNVDIFWVPAVPLTADYADEQPVINDLTGQPDICTPFMLRAPGGAITTTMNAIKVWEGFHASEEDDSEERSGEFQVQCQGALFQVDRYLQKPFFPPRPWPLEKLIDDAFDTSRKPHLRTQKLRTIFPAGWKRKVPAYKGSDGVYTPVAEPGTLWTQYTSRQTGSWDHALTGFIQDQMTVMLTRYEDGVTPGNQWTVLHYREGQLMPSGLSPRNQSVAATVSQGRQPVLQVRDRFREPDFSLVCGQFGVTQRLSRDSTQSENIIYGDGTDIDGTVWRNAVISNDGSRTDYLPLAAARDVWPYADNPALVKGGFVSEAYTKYGTGFSQPDAVSSSEQALQRDRQPGYAGTITLKVDPALDFSRWQIQAGMVVRFKYYRGSGERGIPLHISAVESSPEDGTVQLTVDSRFRDLLTVEEALARTRDPLTPVKMLQVNRSSVMIEDIQAPWDYSAGSGFIPKKSLEFHKYKPASQAFPYVDWREKHPPLHYPQYYVKCNAAAPDRTHRWSGPVPILTSEKDTIIRAEMSACDLFGRPLKVPFHWSLYYVNVTPAAMPRDGNGPSPYINGAFESINPLTGQQWPAGNFLAPDPSIIMGWGNRAPTKQHPEGVFERCGFWPAKETDGASPDGLFVDEANWAYDNTNNPNYNRLAKAGQRQPTSAITIYAMFYCEYSEPVYFQGRLYRQNPGTS